jgi:hypothetical protein
LPFDHALASPVRCGPRAAFVVPDCLGRTSLPPVRNPWFVMRKLWTERRSSHQGQFVNFTNVLSYSKRVSKEGVSIWFGGKAVRRSDG